MIPQHWTAKLVGVPWREAYASVETVARAYLKAHPLLEFDTISTQEFVEALFPERLANGEGITARRRLFKALMALAEHGLSDCATRGVAQRLFGRKGGPKVRPWRWHAPDETIRVAKPYKVGDTILFNGVEYKIVSINP